LRSFQLGVELFRIELKQPDYSSINIVRTWLRLGFLAVLMSIQLTIHQKGLALISIPLIFLLIFLFLAIRIQRQSEQAALETLRLSHVITQAEQLQRLLVDAESGMRGLIVTGNGSFLQSYNQAVSVLPESTQQLHDMVHDPLQRKRMGEIEEKARLKLQHMAVQQALMSEGKQEEARAYISTGVGRQLMDAFRSSVKDFLVRQRRLEFEERSALNKSWVLFSRVAMIGGAIGLLLTFGLATVFYRKIGQRLDELRSNVRRLAQGSQLGSPIAGQDEFAQLDRDFRQMAAQLDEARRRERLVLNQSLDVICSIDSLGNFASVSPASQRLWGYEPSEIIGKPYMDMVFPEDAEKTRLAAEQIMGGTPLLSFENRYVRKDGGVVDIQWTAHWSDADQLMFGVARDVTERKIAERELRRSAQALEAANKELESFSYSVSHDLRAPLRSLNGFSQALLEDLQGQLDEASQDYLRRICAGAKRMGILIDDLLNLSRVTRSQMQREIVDLSDLAWRVVGDLQAQTTERSVAVSIAPGLEVEADPRLIQIVLENLIGNAWKFSARNPSARIEIGAGTANGQKTFFVKDNGAGFDMNYAQKLFGAFQRLHGVNEFEGTGIGLATVQRIIHRHGGRVWAEGKVGEGATFYFRD